ncbi:MAG: histidine triad nucleotide-binding protein [Chloroflexi bacterium]|nr:histidine triad nucleotide-binding protein [Chloroflexota bacterium]
MWRDVSQERSAEAGDCVFCQIVAGTLPSRQVYSDDEVVAFHDVTPVAKVHILVVPRRHATMLTGAVEADDRILGRLLRVGAEVAEKMGIAGSGYRLAVNQGADAGQIVDHLHVHVIGGQNLYSLGEVSTGTEG